MDERRDKLEALLAGEPSTSGLDALCDLLATWPQDHGRDEAMAQTADGLVGWEGWLRDRGTTPEAWLADLDLYQPRHLIEAWRRSGQAWEALRDACLHRHGQARPHLRLRDERWSHGEFGPLWEGTVEAGDDDGAWLALAFEVSVRVLIQPERATCLLAQARFETPAARALRHDVEALLEALAPHYGEEALEMAWEALDGELGRRLADAPGLDPDPALGVELQRQMARRLMEIMEESQDDDPELPETPRWGELMALLRRLGVVTEDQGRPRGPG